MQKRTNINIHIPNPCHEDWAKMTDTEKGKFCASCEKEVYDFTHSTKQEFLDIYHSAEGPLCGRFRTERKTTCLPDRQAKPPSKEIKTTSKWKPWVVAALGFIGLNFFSSQEAKAQEGIRLPFPPGYTVDLQSVAHIEKDTLTKIRGALKDDLPTGQAGKTYEPKAHAPVRIVSNDTVLGEDVTDENGQFYIRVKAMTFSLNIEAKIDEQYRLVHSSQIDNLIDVVAIEDTLVPIICSEIVGAVMVEVEQRPTFGAGSLWLGLDHHVDPFIIRLDD